MATLIRTLILLFFIATPHVIYGAGITLKPVLIRKGIEGEVYRGERLKPKTKQQIFSSNYFKEIQPIAQKAGLDLKTSLDQSAVAGYSSTNKNFFQLFYNTAHAPNCKRDYLIQRVKLTKSHFDAQDRLYKQSRQYLVEVIKTKNGELKAADRHIRSYSVNSASKRISLIEAEIGCGIISNEVTGRKWPYDKSILYKEVQGYSDKPGVYPKVRFDFSKKYSFGAEFSQNGLKSVIWPYFIKRR